VPEKLALRAVVGFGPACRLAQVARVALFRVEFVSAETMAALRYNPRLGTDRGDGGSR